MVIVFTEFNITILDRPGKKHTIADFLSRLQNIKDNTPVEDQFPDQYLFAISTQTPWFADIANYLVSGKFPSIMMQKTKERSFMTVQNIHGLLMSYTK